MRTGTRGRQLAAVALLSTVGLSGCSALEEQGARRLAPVEPSASATVDPREPTREDLDEIQRLLSARAAAVLAGDEKAFLRTVDADRPTLRAQQRTLFANLEGLDLTEFSYDLDRETLLVAAKVPGRGKTVRPQIDEYVQLEGTLTEQVVNPVQMTFVKRASGWFLGQETQRPTTIESPQERPWFGGPIAVRREGPTTVLVDQARADDLASLVSSIRSDIGYVADVLDEPAAYDVLVDATSNGLKVNFSGLSKAEAAAVSFSLAGVGGKRVGSAIKLNPTQVEEVLEIKGLMRHELTHFLLQEYSGASPTWLTEGVAGYVEFFPSDFSRLQVDDKFYEELMAADRRLPIVGRFDMDVAVNYPISQAVVTFLVSRGGIAKLKDLMRGYRREYESVDVDAHTAKLLRKIYGLKEKDVVAGAFAELAELNH